MEQITALFSKLKAHDTHNNLEYTGFDSDYPATNTKLSPYYYSCQKVVAQAIITHVHDIREKTDVLYGHKRSTPNADQAHEFFMRYDVEPFTIIKDEHYYKGLSTILDMFRPTHLIRPVHFTDLRWYPWNLSANAERPFSVSKALRLKLTEARKQGLLDNEKVSFHNLFNEVFVQTRTDIHKIKNGECFTGKRQADRLYRITVHQKPALTTIEEPDKVRSVFGVPKVLIFAETMFLWPLFNHYHETGSSPILWGYETLNGGWYRLNTEYHDHFSEYRPIFSLDWKEFDMRAYFSCIRDIRDGWRTYFDFDNGYIPTKTYPDSKADPQRLEHLWNWIGYALENMESVTPLGLTYKRKFAGIPSGLFSTQFLDSCYNGLMILTVLSALGFTVTRGIFLKVMGDDGLFGVLELLTSDQRPVFLAAFEAEAKRRFNAKLSHEKSSSTDTIDGAQILSYRNRNGYPVRDKVGLLAQLLFPKSFNDDYSKLKARAIGIYYASAGLHPEIRNVCEDIFNFIHAQGIMANRAGLRQLWDPHLDVLGDIEIDRFPTVVEVTCRLSRPSKRTPETQSHYWNEDHFLMKR